MSTKHARTLCVICASLALSLQFLSCCSAGSSDFGLSQDKADDSSLSLGSVLQIGLMEATQLSRERNRVVGNQFVAREVRDGVPPGVECDVLTRCDSRNVCARVCAPGTVRLDPWQQWAVDYQWSLARRQPLCFAQLLGTHNSAISLTEGYGMHDDIFTSYLWYLGVPAGKRVVTNNQALSLTDQLRMGVRFVELDVHWVKGALRIAHCGGFHSPQLNQLVAALNALAALFGHPVQWDAETLGCDPSMSSIPVGDQRLFSDALSEVSSWLLSPATPPSEFLVLYLDNQPDLGPWGHVAEMLTQITDAIPKELILSPPELRTIMEQRRKQAQEQGATGPVPLPSVDELVGLYGKRVLLMSGSDYGHEMDWLAFNHRSPCNFSEPQFRGFTAAPSCSFTWWRSPNRTIATMAGRMLRTPTCHLTYGPYNCSMQYGENRPVLDPPRLAEATTCGINVPAPDMLTPDLVREGYLWSWAPGHPPQQRAGQGAGDGGLCGAMRPADGRWVAVACERVALAACRFDAGPQHTGAADAWVLVARGQPCPNGYAPSAPHTARENAKLLAVLRRQLDDMGMPYVYGSASSVRQDRAEDGMRLAEARTLDPAAYLVRAGLRAAWSYWSSRSGSSSSGMKHGRTLAGAGGAAGSVPEEEWEVLLGLELHRPSWLPADLLAWEAMARC